MIHPLDIKKENIAIFPVNCLDNYDTCAGFLFAKISDIKDKKNSFESHINRSLVTFSVRNRRFLKRSKTAFSRGFTFLRNCMNFQGA